MLFKKLFIISMLIILSTKSFAQSDQEIAKQIQDLRMAHIGDVEGNGQLIVKLPDGSKVAFEAAMDADTRRYSSFTKLPDGNETNPIFNQDYKKSFLTWIDLIKNNSKDLADELLRLAKSSRFTYVNKELHFPTEKYPEDKLPIRYPKKFVAATYFQDEIYISIPSMNKITKFNGLTKKEMQGFVLIHEVINVKYKKESKKLDKHFESCSNHFRWSNGLRAIEKFYDCKRSVKKAREKLAIKKIYLGISILQLITRDSSKFDFHLSLLNNHHQYWKNLSFEDKKDLFHDIISDSQFDNWFKEEGIGYRQVKEIFVHLIENKPLDIYSYLEKIETYYEVSKKVRKSFNISLQDLNELEIKKISYEDFKKLLLKIRNRSKALSPFSYFLNDLYQTTDKFDKERTVIQKKFFEPAIGHLKEFTKNEVTNECTEENYKFLQWLTPYYLHISYGEYAQTKVEELYFQPGLAQTFLNVQSCHEFKKELDETVSYLIKNFVKQSNLELFYKIKYLEKQDCPNLAIDYKNQKIKKLKKDLQIICKNLTGQRCDYNSSAKDLTLEKGKKYYFVTVANKIGYMAQYPKKWHKKKYIKNIFTGKKVNWNKFIKENKFITSSNIIMLKP